MSYRPICDTWILARSKVKYYGAYPAGFLGRARALLGVTEEDSVMHLCAGRVKDYPFSGLGKHDVTVDLDPDLQPDMVHNIKEPFDPYWYRGASPCPSAILADPPYTEEDADHYKVGRSVLPTCGDIFNRANEVLSVGERVGILHYIWPRPPKNYKNIAVVNVLVGFNNRGRLYSVYERVE